VILLVIPHTIQTADRHRPSHSVTQLLSKWRPINASTGGNTANSTEQVLLHQRFKTSACRWTHYSLASHNYLFVWYLTWCQNLSPMIFCRLALWKLCRNPSWQADSHSSSTKIPRLLWNEKVHHRVHNSPPTVPVLSQTNPVHTVPTCFIKIHLIFSSHLWIYLQWPFLFRPLDQNCARISRPLSVLHAPPISPS
jgi:hypothetical protein